MYCNCAIHGTLTLTIVNTTFSRTLLIKLCLSISFVYLYSIITIFQKHCSLLVYTKTKASPLYALASYAHSVDNYISMNIINVLILMSAKVYNNGS